MTEHTEHVKRRTLSAYDLVGLIGWTMILVGAALEFGWAVALMLNGSILLAVLLIGLLWKRRSDVPR